MKDIKPEGRQKKKNSSNSSVRNQNDSRDNAGDAEVDGISVRCQNNSRDDIRAAPMVVPYEEDVLINEALRLVHQSDLVMHDTWDYLFEKLLYPSVVLEYGHRLSLLPAMIVGSQSGLGQLCYEFSIGKAKRCGNDFFLPPDRLHPQLKLPYMYLVAWFVHCLVLMPFQ
ncbi:uncharacterized protein A4U43_C02F14130 [Asparagus officinalis]|uniref:Uncharacterized protein n=1 Tax=Asparagus officinalis TaxID=4686 RepID=A0A5P1FK32_ASPOF|nr:uncharacterized protein A4U43_C02F14130 [Asparagus officinalis]